MRAFSITQLSVSAALAATGFFGAVAAHATAIPAASFVEFVSGSSCSAAAQTIDGICSTSNATASTSGGVFGTPGYDPSTPGTSLQANIFSSGRPATLAYSTMIYDFQVSGPANTYVPIDFINEGILSVVGSQNRGAGAAVLLGLLVTEDFGGHGVLLQHTAGVCTGKGCDTDDFSKLGGGWSGIDRFCVLTGMNYKISMGALSYATGGAQAYGKIDPVIKVDPPPFDPPQTECVAPSDADLPLYSVGTSGNTSSGEVPEPGTLGLLGLGLLGLGAGQLRRRSRRN
jgi:hypothetical protein